MTRTLAESAPLIRHSCLWAETASPPPPTTQLTAALAADVAVIGAGFTGLSTALHLAQQGASVVVLEAAAIGSGGSGRNVGLVNAGLWLSPREVATTLGADYGDRLLRALAEGPQAVFELIERCNIECEATRTGSLHCATDQRGVGELERRAAQWQARGAPVRLLGTTEIARLTGGRGFVAGLLDSRAGTIQPLAYARGLARAGLAAGVKIFTESAARAVQSSSDGHTVRTENGSVRAKWVVVATDMYSTHPGTTLRTEQVRLPYFNVATEPLSGDLLETVLPGRQGAWDTRRILSSFRLDRAGRLIFGSVGDGCRVGARGHFNWARRAIAALFPQLGAIPLRWRWCGSIGMTNDNIPRFHRLAPNVLAISGYNGRGIAPATVFGRLAAQFILGSIRERDLPLPVTTPNTAPFRVAKEFFYLAGSHMAHLLQRRLRS